MKKLLPLLLALLLIVGLSACGDNGDGDAQGGRELDFETVQLAFIHVGDPADMGYTYRQHRGTTDMMAELGIGEDQVMNFFNRAPGDVPTAILESIEWGADLIFGTSFAFESHMLEAAQEHPDIQFFHATGNQAKASGLDNMHNYFGNMSQARFLSGIAAGLRTETNVLGFVAAHPFAEVITGYTAFYLGALSVNPDVTMYVMYTNQWNDPTLEQQAAQALIDRGADVIGQHADSTATQTAAEANGVWSVGYNNDMIPAAPSAVLTSPMFDWSIYLTYAVRSVVEGSSVQPDFLAGLAEGMVLLSPLNPNTVTPDAEGYIESARAALLAGKNVFTGPIYDNEGNQLLADGEEFIEPLAAPSWAYIIQGITIIE
ncbi:MAG: BMP family ABC transporter substrate-binding protein [Oscillospiraceae bacterium]|nr:BMP family ABC transporter substrate-binding protein [Oscillospiraceae bacterium]